MENVGTMQREEGRHHRIDQSTLCVCAWSPIHFYGLLPQKKYTTSHNYWEETGGITQKKNKTSLIIKAPADLQSSLTLYTTSLNNHDIDSPPNLDQNHVHIWPIVVTHVCGPLQTKLGGSQLDGSVGILILHTLLFDPLQSLGHRDQ